MAAPASSLSEVFYFSFYFLLFTLALLKLIEQLRRRGGSQDLCEVTVAFD